MVTAVGRVTRETNIDAAAISGIVRKGAGGMSPTGVRGVRGLVQRVKCIRGVKLEILGGRGSRLVTIIVGCRGSFESSVVKSPFCKGVVNFVRGCIRRLKCCLVLCSTGSASGVFRVIVN